MHIDNYLHQSSTVPNVVVDPLEKDLEKTLLKTMRLHVYRGQSLYLLDPTSDKFRESTTANRYIKLAVTLIEKKVSTSEYDEDIFLNRVKTDTGQSKRQNSSDLLLLSSSSPSITMDFSSYQYQLARGRVAQQLATSSCIAITIRRWSEVLQNSTYAISLVDESRLPSSCQEAFSNEWFSKMKKTDHDVKSYSSTIDKNELQKQHQHRLMQNASSLLSTVICGGIWVPRGGRIGEMIPDTLLSFPSCTDSIVFELDPNLLIEIEKYRGYRSSSTSDGKGDSSRLEHYAGGGEKTNGLRVDQDHPHPSDETRHPSHLVQPSNSVPNVSEVFPTSHQQITITDSQEKEHNNNNNRVNAVHTKETNDDLRICFYPSTRPSPSIIPHDIGSLRFIDPPTLLPSMHPIHLRTPVRIFLNPGWSLDVSILGSNFSQYENLLSLKLGDCSGFFDSLMFQSSHSYKILKVSQTLQSSSLPSDHHHHNTPRGGSSTSALSQQLWETPELLDEAFFSFGVNFKSEESE